MKQNSLFDSDDDATPIRQVGIAGSQPVLGKQQKRFNKLIAEIEARRVAVAAWRDFVPVYQQRCSQDLHPLSLRLREQRIAMVQLLDRAIDGGQLGKRQREKVCDILLGQIEDLLDEEDDDDLSRLYDKHSDDSLDDDISEEQMTIMQEMAGRLFGVDLDKDSLKLPQEELEALIAERMDAAERADEARSARARSSKPKSKKAAAAEAARQRTELDASQAIREVYRKLVSELHPDREPDADTRSRKTELMQKVNLAYEARDLLGLLQLQLSIEQIDPAALAGMAEDRLARYNLVLKEQLQRLEQEQAELMSPFLAVMRLGPRGRLTPDEVLQSVAAEVRGIKSDIKRIKADLVHFRDIANLKASLKHYRVGRSDELDELDQLMAAMQESPRRRRR